MRLWIALVLLAGCAASPVADEPASDLEVYVFWYGDGVMTAQDSPHPLAWMALIHNPTDAAATYTIASSAIVDGRMGPVDRDGWHAQEVVRGNGSMEDTLGPGQSRLWILEGDWFCCHGIWLDVVQEGREVQRWEAETTDGGGQPIAPGMHVQTRTVGVWTNGTSFYTNIPQMIEDERFPAGFDRAAALASAAALPVYVYDQDRSEQPPRSTDACYFTTIPGYNALLKSQATTVTAARFLAPEEGYTRPGNEQHSLYGDPLVFMNTVVAVDDRDERLDPVPDPTAPCFDPERYVPPVRALAPT